jgi:hypothetical protein
MPGYAADFEASDMAVYRSWEIQIQLSSRFSEFNWGHGLKYFCALILR